MVVRERMAVDEAKECLSLIRKRGSEGEGSS